MLHGFLVDFLVELLLDEVAVEDHQFRHLYQLFIGEQF